MIPGMFPKYDFPFGPLILQAMKLPCAVEQLTQLGNPDYETRNKQAEQASLQCKR